jgi:hypothetical protein
MEQEGEGSKTIHSDFFLNISLVIVAGHFVSFVQLTNYTPRVVFSVVSPRQY